MFEVGTSSEEKCRCQNCGEMLHVGFNENIGIDWFHDDTGSWRCYPDKGPHGIDPEVDFSAASGLYEVTQEMANDYIRKNPECGQKISGEHSLGAI